MILASMLIFSISSIQAKDVNVTDFDTLNDDGLEIPFDNLESVDSDVLSSNAEDNSLNENSKNLTELTFQTTDVYYKGSYSVILNDLNSNSTLANKNVNFVINNVKYAATTDDNGVASVNLDLNPGTYKATATFAGDDSYGACNVESQFKILPTVKASDITKYYKGAQRFDATFFDSSGKVLRNTEVTITVNGKSYTKKTNSKGIASFPVDFKPGNYQIISTNPIDGYTVTTNLKILSTISASDFKKVKGDNRKFTVKFFKNDGKALSNKQVKIKVNGKVQKVKTNSNGQASLLLNNLKTGTYKAICYNPDGLSKTYNVQILSKASTKLTLNTSKVYTILPNGSKDVNIKLTTTFGGNTKVGKSIKITINGDTYYRTTDSKGEVNFKIPVSEGIFDIEYSYAGDKFFKSSKVTNHVTVLKTNITKLTVKSTKSFGFGAGTLFKVALTAGKVPIAQKTVYFGIGDKTYTAVTDSNGIASVPIDLNIGNYTVGYIVPDDSQIKGYLDYCDIVVFERSQPKITWKCGYSYKDSEQVFKILVTDSKGSPVSGGIIEFTINGRTFTGKTSSDGYVTFKTHSPVGKYVVSAKFLGSNECLPNSSSKSIKIELSTFGSGLNVKDGGKYSSAYLKSTRNCQVNHPKIKALVKSLTEGLTDDIDKAKAIFYYVRDNIAYSYYYDSKRGAVGTLTAKSGNCVDQAHLLIAMYRTAGFKARYVHGTCRFSDGTFGHVWTQVLIGNTWIVGDPISYGNSFGKISNWNTNTYHLNSRYISLPF